MPSPAARGVVTSGFGMRHHPITGVYRQHNGEDRAQPGNYSPVSGEVVFAKYDTSGAGFGNAVAVREGATNIIWWMAHFASIAVTVGQYVTQGRYLGPMGATGAAVGKHVHTERRVGGTNRPLTGTATDPALYYTSTAGGGTITPITTRKKTMSTLYYKQGTTPTLYALAGDSPGTTANWLETTTVALATSWAAAHGNASLLSAATWDLWKTAYLEPLNTAGAASGGFTAADRALLEDIPTGGEMGQALTSTVALVNEHADENRDAVIAAIPSGGAGGVGSSYDLSLTIPEIPGTATGTATPA